MQFLQEVVMKKFLLFFAVFLLTSKAFADDILIFSASWCPPCTKLKEFLKSGYYEELKESGHVVTIVDIDLDPELKKKWNITSVPTTIVFKENKEEKDRFIGYSKTIWKTWIEKNIR
jgi:thiol-disulfide isomerase/thioredoxin